MSFESYTPPSQPAPAWINEAVLYNSNLKTTFEHFDTAHWIETFKVEDEYGAVDIEKTADNVGVPVAHELPMDESRLLLGTPKG